MGLEGKELGRQAAMGKNGMDWQKFLTHKNSRDQTAYSIGIEPKRRSDLLRMEPRELQANHGKEIQIKEDNDTKENLWSGNDAEPGIFCGF